MPSGVITFIFSWDFGYIMAWKSVAEQKAESERIETAMKKASVEATERRAEQGKLTRQQKKNVRRYSRYTPRKKREILAKQKAAGQKAKQKTAAYVESKETFKTKEKAKEAREIIARQGDWSNVRITKRGEQYAVAGKYTGPRERVTKTAARKTPEKPALKPGEIKVSPERAYEAGIISKRDYERTKGTNSYVLTKEEYIEKGKEYKKKLREEYPEKKVSPGATAFETYIATKYDVTGGYPEKEIEYGKRAFAGLSEEEIKRVAERSEKEPTFGEKIMSLSKQKTPYQKEAGKLAKDERVPAPLRGFFEKDIIFRQWIKEAGAEFVGAPLHGAEILAMRPASRKVISNIVGDIGYEVTKPGEGRKIVKASATGIGTVPVAVVPKKPAGVKPGTFGFVTKETGKQYAEYIKEHPVEFGVKTAATAALTYGLVKLGSWAVGKVKVSRVPLSQTLSKAKTFVSQGGKRAVSSVRAITKAGKHGKFSTKVASVYEKTAAGKDFAQYRAAHSIKTATPKSGIITQRGRSVSYSYKIGKDIYRTTEMGKIATKGEKAPSYVVSKAISRRTYTLNYPKPARVQTGFTLKGSGLYVDVAQKQRIVSIGSGIRLSGKFKPTAKGTGIQVADIYKTVPKSKSFLFKPGTSLKTTPKTGMMPTAGIAGKMALEAGRKAAKTTLLKELTPKPPKIPTPYTSPKILGTTAKMDIKVESPAKVTYGPKYAEMIGIGTGMKKPMKRKTVPMTGELSKMGFMPRVKSKKKQEYKPRVSTLFASMTRLTQRPKTTPRTTPRTIPNVMTEQLVTPRMRMRQTPALLLGLMTGQTQRVARPAPITATLFPQSAFTSQGFAGIGLPSPKFGRRKPKKKKPWWEYDLIHPVAGPIEFLFGKGKKKKRRKK